ncbi:protein PAXX isoform X3 [Myiozetetes cayanensis]|uniref:protein PAXX isoform X3 n=1 Tax=Myiozetetes cayanensis TaxID=478635 RepID=UPI00215F87E8|nr:protein PAXX isoform X3 [Myiozetetes cayanensis]
MRWRSGPRTSATVRRLAAYVPGPGSAVGLAPEARGAGGAEMDSARVRPCRTCSPPPPSLQRCPPEEHSAMLRAALGRGTAELSLGPGSATLRLPEEPRCPALALAQLPPAEARRQLQALVFGMAGCIETLERRLEAVETLATSCSPQKNSAQSQQLFLPDPSPRKNRAAGSALPAKRKVPGESLINPGFKRSVLAARGPHGLCLGHGLGALMLPPSPPSKKVPSGVNFEDS